MPVRAHNTHEPRAPSIGSTQRLSTPGSPLRWDESFHAYAAGTPASQPTPYRLVRGMARRRLLPRTPGASKPALHPRERCLSPNLCSRLIVTGIRKPPSSRAWSLRSADLRDLQRASDPARLYRTRHESSTKTRASRCRHHLPRVANRFGADFASCGPKASSSRDVWLPRHDSYGRFQPLHEPRQQDH
jgi:hypothetical protein